jgi:hypothetical protein
VIDFQSDIGDSAKRLDELVALFKEPHRIEQSQGGDVASNWELPFTKRLENVEFILRWKGEPGYLWIHGLLNAWGVVWCSITKRTVFNHNATMANRLSGFFWKKYGRTLRIVVLEGDEVARKFVVDHSTVVNDLPTLKFHMAPQDMGRLEAYRLTSLILSMVIAGAVLSWGAYKYLVSF